MGASLTEVIAWAQRYLESRLRCEALVADLLQEVVQRLWEASRVAKPLTLAYVRAVCDSVLADHYRACLRQPPCVSLETCAEYAVVEAGYEAVENRLLLEQALAQLSERDRAIVEMHYLDELPFEQIGQALGISTECAKKACQRAIAKLQRWAKECGGGGRICARFSYLPVPCARECPLTNSGGQKTMALSLSLSRVKRQKWVPIALIGLGVAWLGALAVQAQVTRGVRLWFIGAERHLGTYRRGDVITHRIWMINPTLREVKVAVQPSCGCSVAELPYDAIPPLNAFPIEVRIETYGQPLGWQEKGFVIEARQGDHHWHEVVKVGLEISQ